MGGKWGDRGVCRIWSLEEMVGLISGEDFQMGPFFFLKITENLLR